MNNETKTVLDLFQDQDYASALEKCETLVQSYITSFMEELTVNSATDYVGSVILYSQICSALKKPWKSFRKMEASRGALRFMKDFMTDSDTLAQAYLSYADAYAYGGYLPEAVGCYLEASKLFDDFEKAQEAFSSALYFEQRFGKDIVSDPSFFEDKFGVEKVLAIKEAVLAEAAALIRTDPVENTDAYLAARYEVEEKTDGLVSQNSTSEIPFCVLYWDTKKSVLKDCFGIDWKSPAEMNPNIRFY